MGFDWLSISFVGAGLLALLMSVYFLTREKWFKQWLRGSLGISLVGFSLLLILMAVNLYTYQQLTSEKPVATVSIQKLGRQIYTVKIDEPNGHMSTFELYGDLWQLDARIIKWHGILNAAGLKPGYKLDRIQGRYVSIEDEHSKQRSVYSLADSTFGIDIWKALQSESIWLPWVDTSYGSATYVPMKDGAIYAVNLSATGLLARPLNDVAEKAILNYR